MTDVLEATVEDPVSQNMNNNIQGDYKPDDIYNNIPTNIHTIKKVDVISNKKFNYVVSKKIYYAYKTNGFFSAVVQGRRGVGKSSYALTIMHDLFVYMGHEDSVAWQMAIDRMLYNISDIVSFIENSSGDKKEAVFTWDDASVFGGNLRYFSHMKEVNLLSSLMDTIRSSVGGVLLTCPSQFGLLKFLRRYDNYIIDISYGFEGGWNRIAKGYLKCSLPSGKGLVYYKFSDFYSAYLPKKVYALYMEKRNKYNEDNARYLKELINKKKGGEKKNATA